MQNHVQEPIDIIMWTLNGEKTLSKCLSSIDQGIPKKCINQKIMVDGNSTDNTREIGEKFGWNVIPAKKRGIPYQANQALDAVETEFFASFEQDLQLNPSWYSKMKLHFENPNVAAAQGVRFCVNPTLNSIEKYAVKTQGGVRSLDNNIYRTAIIKKLRFNEQCPYAASAELYNKIKKQNYTWVLDRTVASQHLKTSVHEFARKARRDAKKCRYLHQTVGFNRFVKMFLFSPIRGLAIAKTMHCPAAVFVYPYIRLQWILNGKV